MRRICLMLLILPLLSGCVSARHTSFPEELTPEQAAEIAIPYFLDHYGLETVPEQTEYVRVGKRKYQNRITVRASDGTRYELRLDGSNAPLADNVLCVRLIAAAGVTSLLGQPCQIEPCWSLTEETYVTVCSVRLAGAPGEEDRDAVFAALETLSHKGISELNLLVHTPAFLMPPSGHGLQLGARWFETDLNRDAFESQYEEWADQLFWHEQKFRAIKAELLSLGASDGYFCLPSRYTGNGVTIILYWEGNTPLSWAQENRLLRQLKDSCIRLGDHRIIFRIQRK